MVFGEHQETKEESLTLARLRNMVYKSSNNDGRISGQKNEVGDKDS